MSVGPGDGPTILRLGVGAAFLLAAVAGVASLLSPDLGRDTGRVVLLGWLPVEIPESSGVAVSRAHRGVFWTHNDRGRPGRLYAVGFDGTLLARFDVSATRAVDWEDIALGPCPGAASGDCLFVADTGDNGATRASGTLLVIPEPAELASGILRPVASVRIRLSDGPADVEALALGDGGDGWIFTKGQDGASRAYRIPAARLATGGDIELAPEATLPIDVGPADLRVTGAATSPDGRRIAIRTARRIYLFDPGTWATPLVCAFPGLQRQPEGLDFVGDSALIVTTESDGTSAPIYRVRCP